MDHMLLQTAQISFPKKMWNATKASVVLYLFLTVYTSLPRRVGFLLHCKFSYSIPLKLRLHYRGTWWDLNDPASGTHLVEKPKVWVNRKVVDRSWNLDQRLSKYGIAILEYGLGNTLCLCGSSRQSFLPDDCLVTHAASVMTLFNLGWLLVAFSFEESARPLLCLR